MRDPNGVEDSICLVTNRNVTEEGYGERSNAKGIGEVSVATARVVDNDDIVIRRLVELESDDALPSQRLFNSYLKLVREASLGHRIPEALGRLTNTRRRAERQPARRPRSTTRSRNSAATSATK